MGAGQRDRVVHVALHAPRRSGAEPASSALIRKDDVNRITVTCSEPVGLQVDGDYLGLRKGATFCSVPAALRVLTGVPARLRSEEIG